MGFGELPSSLNADKRFVTSRVITFYGFKISYLYRLNFLKYFDFSLHTIELDKLIFGVLEDFSDLIIKN